MFRRLSNSLQAEHLTQHSCRDRLCPPDRSRDSYVKLSSSINIIRPHLAAATIPKRRIQVMVHAKYARRIRIRLYTDVESEQNLLENDVCCASSHAHT